MSASWSIWSWDAKNLQWLEVGSGTEKEMQTALDRKRAAAERLLPEAQFAISRTNDPPNFIPEDRTGGKPHKAGYPFDPDPPDTDRLLELIRRRVQQWEAADSLRKEREAAEAFTRAFAELDAALSADNGVLPQAWAGAGRPDDSGGDGSIYPVKELLGAHGVRLEKGGQDA